MTNDPWVWAALDAQARLGAAMRRRDLAAVEQLLAPDLVVHAPINAVVTRDSVLARLGGGKIGYEESERQVEFADTRGDSVVIMGLESSARKATRLMQAGPSGVASPTSRKIRTEAGGWLSGRRPSSPSNER